MNKSSSSSLKKELAALPIARIETMDQSYTLPLREYLFTNGCQVFVNSGPTENVTYFFVVGDSNFVKKTLAFRHELGKKQLIVCWDPDDHESIQQFLGDHTKIVYVDPVALTDVMITEIFTFLFTTKGKELDMQTVQPKKFSRYSDRDETLQPYFQPIENEKEKEEEPLIPSLSKEYEDVQKHRIARVITDMFGKKDEPTDSPKTSDDVGKQKRRNARRVRLWLSHLLVVFLLTCLLLTAPFLLYIGSTLIRGWYLTRAATNFKEGKGNRVTESIQNEKRWSGYTHFVMPFVHTSLRLPLGDQTVQALERVDRLIDVVADAELELLSINDAVISMGSSLLVDQKDKQPLPPVVAVDTIRKNMPAIRNNLDIAASYLTTLKNQQSFPFSLPYVQTQLEKASNKITKLRQVAEVGERVAQLYPFIGGFRDTQNVVVVLQNSSELRPTGGFIGSLAHLSISEGVLSDLRIEDVYNLDGQLKGHIDPPGAVKDLLSQEHWYLRDSNWNPDFAESAKNIKFFYTKETGEQIDSVVGVTSSFIVRILRVIGPVDIPFYNDRITADNFYLKSIYYTQANFFPGSSQKKDFLGTLMEALLAKLQKNPQSGIAIMEIIHDSLAARDIQWYSTDPSGQQAIEQFGWGGKVPSGSTCLGLGNQPACLFSYLYINEANVSVNKVNSFVDRSQTRSVQISDDGNVTETITRKIQNLSQGQSGTGPYATYLRLYIPSNTTMTNLTLDGKPIPMKTSSSKHMDMPYGELDTSTAGLSGVAIAFEVEPGRERSIALSFSLNQTVPSDQKEIPMTFFEQKQPGVDTVPGSVLVQFPPSWVAVPYAPGQTDSVVAKPGYLQYNTNLAQDSEFSVRFLR